MEKSKRITYLKTAIKALSVFIITIFAIYLWGCYKISGSINSISNEALREFEGDRVIALISYADCNKYDLRKRDSAVWALGQIGDKRALPILQKYYTGENCDHQKNLCQHELKKAIEGCSGKFNATAWMRYANYFDMK